MSPQLNAGNMRRGLRSLRDLTQHLTTRADDSHAPPVIRPRREALFPGRSGTCQAQVRFLALRPIKPHADRKSTRLNSSHANISYAVFCLKKKNPKTEDSNVCDR